MMISEDKVVPTVVVRPPADIIVLYHTLVADYEQEFSSLGPVMESSARRRDNLARLTNVQASLRLNELNKQKAEQAKEIKTSADQFLLAAESAPRQKRRRGERTSPLVGGARGHAGPNTNAKGQTDCRATWGVSSFLGARRRASTPPLPFLNWLALNHDIGYLTDLEHVTECLPCTRNALRGAHGNGIHGRSRGSRACRKASLVCSVIWKEVLANTMPGCVRPSKPPECYLRVVDSRAVLGGAEAR